MIPLTLAQIAQAVDGELTDVVDPEIVVTTVVSDSRDVTAGSLFVAIRGERVDGHDFANDVIATGAVALLAARRVGQPAIVVADPVLALGALAKYALTLLPDCKVVAITGSSGKTSTKDLIAQMCGAVGPTVAPKGSLNTEVGVPLTILRADVTTKFLVLEMGMRGIGHIAYLTQIARPDVAVVLNIGSAHAELLGSKAAIASAKGEIFAGLREGGIAIANGDDQFALDAASGTSALTFGESLGCAVRATDVRLDDQARPSFTLRYLEDAEPVSLKLHGEHFIANALAAASVGIALGMSVSVIADVLRAATLESKWRMEVHQAASGVTVINDAYNANPESMRAALKALTAMAAGRRSWAVLGEMRELGAMSLEEHDAIGRLVVRLDVSRLIAVGEGARAIHLAAAHEGSWGNESMWVATTDEALEVLRGELQPDDVVLVKASRASGLDVIATALCEEGTA